MQALQVVFPGQAELIDIPLPDPQPGEVRVRIEAVTICTQWDLHLAHDSPMYPGHRFHYPYTVGQPGHEGSGVVEALGQGVTEFKLGDRVSLWRDPGHDVQGCYAQFVCRPVHDVIRVPQALTPVATAPVELAMCVACSVLRMKSMDVIRGKRLAVSGLGPAGQIGVQMLLAEGATDVVGIDPHPVRRQLGVQLGASEALTPDEAGERFPARDRAVLDSALDCVGTKRSVEFLMDRVDDVVQLSGVQREDYSYAVRHWLGLRLCGYPPHYRGAAEYAVGLVESGKLDLLPLVSHSLPMGDYARAIDMLESQEANKVCLLPWQS